MSDPRRPLRDNTDRKPARQTGESKGSIDQAQVTDENMRRKNLPRGSEPETRASSRNRP